MMGKIAITVVSIRTHDMWIQKRVCFPLHHSALPPVLSRVTEIIFEFYVAVSEF